MIDASRVSACLVTRGDQPEMIARIIETLPYDDIVLWDNSRRDIDVKTYGRYRAISEAKNRVIYFQDDDCLFRDHDELLASYEPGLLVANNGHGGNDGGYGDLALVCGGALVDRELPEAAAARYLEHWPLDEAFMYDCDFALGVLTPFRHTDLEFEIVTEVATHPSRLCNQPWQEEMKALVTRQARQVRDRLPTYAEGTL